MSSYKILIFCRVIIICKFNSFFRPPLRLCKILQLKSTFNPNQLLPLKIIHVIRKLIRHFTTQKQIHDLHTLKVYKFALICTSLSVLPSAESLLHYVNNLCIIHAIRLMSQLFYQANTIKKHLNRTWM